MLRVRGLAFPKDDFPMEFQTLCKIIKRDMPVTFEHYKPAIGKVTEVSVRDDGVHLEMIVSHEIIVPKILDGTYRELSYVSRKVSPYKSVQAIKIIEIGIVEKSLLKNAKIHEVAIINHHLNVAILFVSDQNLQLFRFLRKDGDHTAMMRVLKFLL